MSSYGRWVITAGLCLALIAAAFAARDRQHADRLVMHEWGTFTVLQDEAGREIAAINNDDEPLPPFVHRLAQSLVTVEPAGVGFQMFAKGIVASHPDVIMRLETPVVYFHLPAGVEQMQLDLSVGFRGGWVSEWFPSAAAEAPGVRQELDDRGREFTRIGHVRPDATGKLAWRGLTVGGEAGAFPETGQNVWLAPRKVEAAPVRTTDGQAEQYLFYRGVGNLKSPLRVLQHEQNMLHVEARFDIPDAGRIALDVPVMWLVDIRPDKALSFREIEGFQAVNTDAPRIVATTSSGFADHSRDHLPALRQSMRAALIADGLFADEADAMLNTWEAAYFQTAGTRLFYIVPQEWTDHVLPMSVSVPAEVRRVMVGRVELVTAKQRKLIEQIAAGPASSPAWLFKAVEQAPAASDANAFNRLLAGEVTLEQLSITPPADWQAFMQLGRFRRAIVLHELKHRPTDPLRQFAQHYRIRYSTIE